MMLRITAVIIILLSAISLVTGCSAPPPLPPPTTGGLQITVADAANQPLSGAKVVSDEQPPGQLKVTGITANNGIVTFSDLKPGPYRFNISRSDYSGLILQINVVAGQTPGISANLSPLSPKP